MGEPEQGACSDILGLTGDMESLFYIYLQPFVLFKLAVYLQSTREKTLELL